MSHKSRITQELANGFPEWSKTRTDDQSIGKLVLNTIGLQLEDLVTTMFRGSKNQFLTIANVGEIDQTYTVSLPGYFELINPDQNREVLQSETVVVSGFRDGSWYEIDLVETGSIQQFWYEALPDAAVEVTTIADTVNLVASGISDDLYLVVLQSGLSLDNFCYITVDCDDRLLEVDERNNIIRSKIRIEGTTWKDSDETEDAIFLFSETKPTFKAWDSIETIKAVDFVNTSTINVYNHRFNFDFYSDSFETISQLDDRRENFPFFWSLSITDSGTSLLNLSTYSATTATDLLLMPPVQSIFRTWDLHDNDNESILIQDICLVPFQQKIYAVTGSGLLVYDTLQELPDTKELVRTANALVNIELSQDYSQISNEVEILCLFKRPLKTIIKQRLSITYPDGEVFGILEDGSLVPSTDDYYIIDDRDNVLIRQPIYLTPDLHGQYKFRLECIYRDASVDIIERIFLVDKKQPLVSLDLSHISTTIVAVDIDHLGRILLLDSANSIHIIELRYDIGILDSLNSEVILRENYSEVTVSKI